MDGAKDSLGNTGALVGSVILLVKDGIIHGRVRVHASYFNGDCKAPSHCMLLEDLSNNYIAYGDFATMLASGFSLRLEVPEVKSR